MKKITGKDALASGGSSDMGMSRSVVRGGTGFAGGMTTSSYSWMTGGRTKNFKQSATYLEEMAYSSHG
jgi:hypothetical protein